jgi:large subunit ribosomal protein L4
VHVVAPDQLNTYDVLVSDDIVFTETSLEAFLRRTPASASPADEATTKATDAGTTKPAGVEADSAATDTAAAEATADEVEDES